MGTNYYLHNRPPCPTCGHNPGPLHIGKSSVGWCFALLVAPDDDPPIRDLDDWERLWSEPGARIEDEYGRAVTPDEMRRIITEREAPSHPLPSGPHGFSGPRRLLRHRVGNGHACIGHGAGTWDLLVGDFS